MDVTSTSLQAKVLSRLLVFQRALAALPDSQQVIDFCSRSLQFVPGVREVLVCVDEVMTPPDERFSDICRLSVEARNPGLINLAVLERQPGTHVFPLRANRRMFGAIIILATDERQLAPFLPALGYVAEFVGVMLNDRLLKADLSRANEELMAVQGELERLVAERTKELEYSVAHDGLTGLINRATLVSRIEQSLAASRRSGRSLAIADLGLDNFRYVQDSFGSPVGDEVLKTIARRLVGHTKGNDSVARIAVDRFALLLADHGGPGSVAAVLSEILESIRSPITVGATTISVTGGVGCSFFPADGENPEVLLKRASIAEYRSQEKGRKRINFYATGEEVAISDRAELESDLHHALEHDELLLHYQPQVDLEQSLIIGVEALMRWNHPRRGLVSPAKFIAMAEDTGMILEMGAWAIREACRQARAWRSAQLPPMSVAVNLSARQFEDRNIVEVVTTALRESGLPPERLELEITEASIMNEVAHVKDLLCEFKQLGVRIAIDDFGTGYSNLSYLRHFPVDALKIDQSFVRDVEAVESAALIARGVIGLGHTLGLQVIAEGVETPGQAKFLYGCGCSHIQGFLISRPQTAADLVPMLKAPLPDLAYLKAPATYESAVGRS